MESSTIKTYTDTVYINVDTKSIRKNDTMATYPQSLFLEEDPLVIFFDEGMSLNILKISCPPSSIFEVGDNIVLASAVSNIKGGISKMYTYNESIGFCGNFPLYHNHEISTYKLDKFFVNKGDIRSETNMKVKMIYIPPLLDSQELPDEYEDIFDVDFEIYLMNPSFTFVNGEKVYESNDTINPITDNKMTINGFFIKIPRDKIRKVDNDIIQELITHLYFNHNNGVLLKYINNGTELEYLVKTHKIIAKYDDGSVGVAENDIISNFKEFESFGGKNIVMKKVISQSKNFRGEHDYTLKLNGTIDNIISCKIVSSVIPNIMDNITEESNKMYWQDRYKGKKINSISIPTGSYTVENILVSLRNKMESFYDYYNRRYFRINFDTSTEEITFNQYEKKIVDNPVIEVKLTKYSVYITIKDENHLLSKGNKIILENFCPVLDVHRTFLNKEHEIFNVYSPDSYIIRVQKSLDKTSIFEERVFDVVELISGNYAGGRNCILIRPTQFRIFADKDDSVCKLLSFKNVGSQSSITPFSYSISNRTIYEDAIDGGEVTNKLFTSSENSIFLSIKELEENSSNTFNFSYFSIITLPTNPGTFCFNTFVESVRNYKSPLKFDELNIKLIKSDGTPYYTRGLNHFFILELKRVYTSLVSEYNKA